MSDAYIIAAARTPVGKRGGALAGVHPVSLGALALGEAIKRAGVHPAALDDVIVGCG